ncbi:epoxide hydrolase 1 precursor [Nasonia vitripennis]|uniref:Epoxide hydrolase n=1 Tax=Nasonia vitripennis TaxID=7425 RepID=B3U0E6_NASVI|nr:epoxide hydrolase 1 precursor [Nasonia vitripennis]ACC55233.1 epoxide hydrolase 1 [Nasonia vitripennis]
MWKGAAVFLLATLAIGWHLRYQGPVEVPDLPNQYWGPGKPVPDPKDIKPFKIDVPKEVIDDLNKRLDSTRSFVEPLEGSAWTYGISSTYLKTVLNHWRKKYNWSQRQALLNKYPQFKTKIQGLDIHFYHVKPQVPKDRKVRVLPLLMLHGWPGSIVEFQKIIPMLTTAKPDENFVFELIIPSLPGYGFSQAAARPGLGPAQMAVVFKNLMQRLGFEQFYTQGGDWGSLITANMAVLYPKKVIGTHLNMCFIESHKAHFLSLVGAYIPSLVVDSEHYSKMYPLSYHFGRLIEETGYLHIQATKPETVGAALTDSPAGLAAYILEKFSTWTNPDYRFRDDGGLLEKFTMDELLDNLMVYWVTNSITTSQRLYAECFSKANRELGVDKMPIFVPTACANFPHELAYRSETILKERFTNLVQFTHPPRGGHFAAFEEPELLANDVWSFVHKLEQRLSDEKRQKQEAKKEKAKKA